MLLRDVESVLISNFSLYLLYVVSREKDFLEFCDDDIFSFLKIVSMKSENLNLFFFLSFVNF